MQTRLYLKLVTLLGLASTYLSIHAAVETRTVRIDFKAPPESSAIVFYDDSPQPLVKVGPWGGYALPTWDTNAKYDNIEGSDAICIHGGGIVVYSGENDPSWWKNDFDYSGHLYYKNDTSSYKISKPEGHGAGLHVEPATPNSQTHAIRIKEVKGKFLFNTIFSGTTYSIPKPSVGSVTYNSSAQQFEWSAGGNNAINVGLFFPEICCLDYMDVTVEIVTGDDITEADLAHDNLFDRQWPEHLFFKQLVQDNGNGRTSYRIPYSQIVREKENPICDIETEDFTCVTTDGLVNTTTMFHNKFNTPFYPESEYGAYNISARISTNRRDNYTARIVSDAPGKVTKIVEAKIYFESVMETEGYYSFNRYVIDRGGGNCSYGKDEVGQYLLWTGSTDDLKVSFKTTYNNYYTFANARVIKYAELTFDTQSGTAMRPWLAAQETGNRFANEDAITYDQLGSSHKLTMNLPAGASKLYYVFAEDGATLASGVSNGKVNSDAKLGASGAAITFDDSNRYVDFKLIATDANGNVLGTSTNRIVNNKFTLRTPEELDSKTYQWKDIDGTVHTSPVTERATDPLQMMSLLKAVYLDPYFPGTVWYDPPVYKTTTRFPQSKLSSASEWSKTWDDTLLPSGKVWEQPFPTEGATMFIAEAREQFDAKDLKDGNYKYGDLNGGKAYSSKWTSEMIQFNETYKSVELLSNSHRIADPNSSLTTNNDYNPGVLFMTSGEYNRFYFLAKGNDSHRESASMRHMYEEIAPYLNDATTRNVYGTLLDGGEPTAEHNCNGVPTNDHWMQMKSNGETQRLDNICIYLPDYRFYRGLINKYGGTYSANHYSGFRPYLSLYTVQLTASSTPSATDGYYTLGTRWETTMNRVVQNSGVRDAAAEEYELWVQELNTSTGIYGEWVKIDGPQDNGYFYSTDHDYDVEQTKETRYFNYRVYARLRGSQMDWVLSNESKVIVPGTQPGQLILLPVDIAHISDFDVEGQLNHYKNYLTMTETSERPMLATYLQTGTELRVYRIPNLGEEHGEKQLFCTVTIGEVTEGGKRIAYTLSYANQDDASSPYYDASLYAAPSGHFTAETPSAPVNFGHGFYMLDQFSADVSDNNHPVHYDYVIEFNDYVSNKTTVPVYKTELTSSVFNYGQAVVDNDTHRELTVDKTAQMQVQVGGQSNVLEYAALRNGTLRVGSAQRGTTGNYTSLKRDDEGKLTVVIDREHIFEPSEGGMMSVPLQDSIANDESVARWYVGKIEANTPNWPYGSGDYLSTYGSARTGVDQPYVSIATSGDLEASSEIKEEGVSTGKQAFRAPIVITGANFDPAESSTQHSTPYLYRVWRVENGDTTLLNNLEDKAYKSNGRSWSTDYFRLSTDLDKEQQVSINDYMIDDMLSSTNTKKTVKYIVRLYAQLAPTGTPARRRATANNDAYCIAEAELPVEFTYGNVITMVQTLLPDSPVVGVTYVNALGQRASQPWPGVNIVVSKHADGGTSSTKLIF